VIDPGDLPAMLGHVNQRKGIGGTLNCGCRGQTECGHHREQRLRVAVRVALAELPKRGGQQP
jgi:hypothetical protein